MPTLADIYSGIDTAKRKAGNFIRQPLSTLQEMIALANDEARKTNQQTALSAQGARREIRGQPMTAEQTAADQDLQQKLIDQMNIGGITAYRAGGKYGLTADRGGPTFYSSEKKGAEPFVRYGPIREIEINPKKVLDTSIVRMKKIYDDFLKETNHPAGYGKTMRPYWTSEPDFREWLKKNGHEYDAIMFDEPTGIPSIAVYGKHETK